jgi:hypothetical protein
MTEPCFPSSLLPRRHGTAASHFRLPFPVQKIDVLYLSKRVVVSRACLISLVLGIGSHYVLLLSLDASLRPGRVRRRAGEITSFGRRLLTLSGARLAGKGRTGALFTKPLAASACGGCKASACMGGCPAEEVVMGSSSCKAYEDIVPVCRLWKSSAKPEAAEE